MDEVSQIIARIPAWTSAKEIRVERIAGLTNANYRITVDGERFVLRVSGQNTDRLGINRIHEAAALQAAEVAGIGPPIVAFIEPEGHLATRWVEGRHWKASEFRTPGHVRLLTETVKRIHALPPNGAAFSPFQRVEVYLQTVRDCGLCLPEGFDNCLETMRAVKADQENDTSHWLRFCHNDLVAVNYLFIEAEQKIIVLDWEFAGLGDLYYDLATVVYTHDNVGPIPAELEEGMLACYFGQVTDWQRKRLRGMKFMLMLFTAMWGLAQHAMQQAGWVAPVEGFDYLEFARYLFAYEIRDIQAIYNGVESK